MYRFIALTAAALLFASLCADLASAQEPRPAFVVLGDESPDVTPWLRELAAPQFCFLDDNGDGAYSAGEPTSVRANGCGSVVGAIRLVGFEGLAAGRFIAASDVDAGPGQSQFSTIPEVRYLDADGNGRASVGDGVYLDAVNPGSGRIEVGDVRLSAYEGSPAGVPVGVGDADLGAAVGSVGPSGEIFAFADVNGNAVFDLGDRLFIRTGGDRGDSIARINDLRLGGSPPTTFGTWTALGDADGPALLRGAPGAAFCLASDSGVYTVGATIVLRATGGCSGASRVGDLAVSGAGGGNRLASDDEALGLALHDLEASLRFREGDGIAGFGSGDGLYLEVEGTASRLDVGDVRLTPWKGLPAAQAVREGDLDVGLRTDAYGPLQDHAAFFDHDGDGSFDIDELFYLDRDGASTESTLDDVETGDTRLGTGPAGFFFGSQTTAGSPEVVTRLLSGAFELCVLDEDGDVLHDVGEAVYLVPSACDALPAEAVRLTSVGGRPAGSFVESGGDHGHVVTAVPYELTYHDSDISSTWTAGDTLYVHFGAGTRIAIGDMRLSPFDDLAGGRSVTSTDADVNANVVSLGSSVAAMGMFYDADHTGALSSGDVVYLDAAQGTALAASYGMVRLTDLPPAQAAPTATSTPSPSPTGSPAESPSPTSVDSPTPSQTLTDAPSPTGDEDDGESPRTPGPALALVLAAVAAMLWLARRR